MWRDNLRCFASIQVYCSRRGLSASPAFYTRNYNAWTLDLADNHIRRFRVGTSGFAVVNLTGNPLDCDALERAMRRHPEVEVISDCAVETKGKYRIILYIYIYRNIVGFIVNFLFKNEYISFLSGKILLGVELCT